MNTWDNYYKNTLLNIQYDGWLDKYIHLLKNKNILDIGCGVGHNYVLLNKYADQLINLDYSKEALHQLISYYPDAKTTMHDITNILPFKTEQFDVVIADLSLHYFTKEDTIMINKEISRILKQNGKLLIRVNTTEENKSSFYYDERMQMNRRYFSIEDVNKLFINFNILKCEKQNIIWRGQVSKVLLECLLQNK